MDHIQISEKFQLERLLFIDKECHKKASPGYTPYFCITQPFTKEVNL